jgi:hypothetical protein
MDLDEKQLFAMRQKAKLDKEKKFLDDSKKRLETIISTKMRTAFIGALDTFEKAFGHLWGYNRDGELTAEQERMSEVWANARNDILNNGNNQLRAIKAELANNTVSWNRYITNLPVKPVKESRNG